MNKLGKPFMLYYKPTKQFIHLLLGDSAYFSRVNSPNEATVFNIDEEPDDITEMIETIGCEDNLELIIRPDDIQIFPVTIKVETVEDSDSEKIVVIKGGDSGQGKTNK